MHWQIGVVKTYVHNEDHNGGQLKNLFHDWNENKKVERSADHNMSRKSKSFCYHYSKRTTRNAFPTVFNWMRFLISYSCIHSPSHITKLARTCAGHVSMEICGGAPRVWCTRIMENSFITPIGKFNLNQPTLKEVTLKSASSS